MRYCAVLDLFESGFRSVALEAELELSSLFLFARETALLDFLAFGLIFLLEFLLVEFFFALLYTVFGITEGALVEPCLVGLFPASKVLLDPLCKGALVELCL